MATNIDFELLLKDEKFIQAVTKSFKQVEKLNKSINKVNQTTKRAFGAKNIVKFGIALVGVQTAALAARKAVIGLSNAATSSIRTFAKFEKNMLAVRTLLDETSFSGKSVEEGFSSMGQEMTRVLQKIPVDANEATKALFDITSAQIEASKATGVFTAASKLAVAGNTSVASSTKAIVKSLVAFNIDASKAEVVAGKFFTAQKLGLTTVEELSKGFGLVAASASQMNISLDETLAAVVGSTRGALDTRKAYIGLAAVFKNIIDPSKEAQEEAKRLNIEFSELGVKSAGGLIPFLQNLKTQLGDNNKAFTTLFGSARSIRQIFSLLTKEGIRGAKDVVKQLSDETKTATTLNDAYSISVNGLSNQWDLLTNNLENVEKSLVTQLAPAFKKSLGVAIEGLRDVFKVIESGELDDEIAKISTSIDHLTTSLKAALPSFTKLVGVASWFLENSGKFAAGINGIVIAASSDVEPTSLNKMQEAGLRTGDAIQRLRGHLETLEASRDRLQGPYVKPKALEDINKKIQAVQRDLFLAERNLDDELFKTKSSQAELLSKLRSKKADELSVKIVKAAKAEQKAQAEIAKDKKKTDADTEIAEKKRLTALGSALELREEALDAVKDIGKTEADLIAENTARQIADIEIATNEVIKHGKLSTDEVEKLRKESNDRIVAVAKEGNDQVHDLELDNINEAAEERAKAVKAYQKQMQDVLSNINTGISSLNIVGGSAAQKSIREAEQKLKIDTDGLQVLPDPNSETIKLSRKQVAQGEATLKSLEQQLAHSKGSSNTGLKFQIQQAKKRLSEDQKLLASREKEFDNRNKDIVDGLEKVEQAQKDLNDSITGRDAEARSTLIGGASTAANAIVPGVGPLVGTVLENLTQDPEDASNFITALVEQIPELVNALVENAPTIVEALARAMPSVAVELAFALANTMIDPSFQVKIALAFRDGIVGGFENASESVKNAIQNFFTDAPDGMMEKINAWVAGLDEAFNKITFPLQTVAEVLTKLAGDINKALGGGEQTEKSADVTKKAILAPILGPAAAFLATGGIVTGSGNKDTVPAVLTPGELVIDRTTGPRLNKFLDSAEGRGQGKTSSSTEGNAQLLAEILSEVRKPINVTSELTFNEDVLADIMLDLDRREERTAG